MVEALLNINGLPRSLADSRYIIGGLKDRGSARTAKHLFSGILLPSSSMFGGAPIHALNAMISLSLCSDCVHARWHSCRYCIFMDIARGLGFGAVAVLIGMRGVGKNLVVQNRKKRDNSSATQWTALIANHTSRGALTTPNGRLLLTTDCNISQAPSSRECVAM
jgi:hypothetical protein